ncbi:hypothetical protein BGZ94_006846 [Podila epigama]|nr:hypothetical protein BGZ94_006846 [Podila epigama]
MTDHTASVEDPSLASGKTTATSSSGPEGEDNHYSHDPKSWPNGKRPKGYRTKEGQEAAERSKKFKSGATVPHLTAPCNTYKGVLRHAVLGAVRSGGLTYGVKALVNLCLGMLKLLKGRGSFGQILKSAFAGQDALRFGEFFGTFSFLWKLVNNGLNLYRGKDDRINGAIAGAIAGLAILIETHERRVSFAQQMFMRSMQGIYHAAKHRGQFSFRHGDALLFAIASGQVLYAYAMHPHTIPKEFFSFMIKTARVPAEALAFNRARVRGFPADMTQVQAMAKRFKGTPQNLAKLAAWDGAGALPCAGLHPSQHSCRTYNFQLLIHVLRSIGPVYATLNFVPLLVLRLKLLMKDPARIISKTSFNTFRSSLFLAIFVTMYQVQICLHRNLIKAGLPLGNSKYLYGLFGATCAGTAIMVEQESRRAELAMYVAPKAATSLYMILYQKNWIKGVKHWEVMMFSFAMSIIMSFYQQEEQVLSPFVTKLIYHILGRS